MKEKKRIGFRTKLLSNYNYLKQVSVDGKKTNSFNFIIAHYDQYVEQINRSGNCITMLSDHFEITEDSFWNTSHFEIISRYIFLTFNKSFLLKALDKIENLNPSVLKRCAELLHENPAAYDNRPDGNTDEELEWCYVKNDNLKKDVHFNKMYEIDKSNRISLLNAVEKKIVQFDRSMLHPGTTNSDTYSEKEPARKEIQFIEMLRPIDGSKEEALNFIRQKTEEAKFKFNIFSSVPKSRTGKNPYGLNGCIAAMIDFFYQHDYFIKEYSLPDIFESFLHYSGNSIPKSDSFLSTFRNDNSFVRHFENLKKLKIKKLPQ